MAIYRVDLTGPQLRVLHETLAVILNDPDWFADSERDGKTLDRAASIIYDGLVKARRAESTPAGKIEL